MKLGIDPPCYKDSEVERVAFNLYSVKQQELMNIANYITTYDESNLETVCNQIGIDFYELNTEDLKTIAKLTGRNIHFEFL